MEKGKKKLSTRVMATICTLALLVPIVWPSQNVYAANNVYLDKGSSYTEENLGQSLESTENAGMIWTDKSVGETGITTFSIGANAQEVIGNTSKPTDTVIILDVSQGMLSTETDKNTGQVVYKIQSALEAANDTIESLMSANPKNRISVVAYSGKRLDTDSEKYNPNNNQVVELLPLAHYVKSGSEDYLSLEFLNVVEKGVSFDPVKNPEGIVRSHALKQGETSETSASAYLGGMSNLQYGLSKGMDVLTNATDIEADGTTRQPNVLLFMGSLPQESCADPQWWNPTLDENNIQYFNRSENDAAHTVKAIMVGAYQKKQIEKRYGVDANLLVSQIYIKTNEKHEDAFTSNDWQSVSMSGMSLQDIVNDYESKTSCEIPAGLQNNKPNAKYVLDQHPAEDITANDIFNYIDGSFSFTTKDFEQNKVLEGTSDVIKDSITEVEAPLEKDSFITYTDPIGEYMQIKPYDSNIEDSGVHFNFLSDNESKVDIVFTKETVQSDGTIEYTNPVAKPNIDNLYHTIYGTNYAEELKKASVRLENENGKKTLVAKIPATLIPMGMSTVRYDENGNLESMKKTAKPFKLVYQVEVDDSIYGAKPNKLIDGKVKSDYLRQNASADGSMVYFYSTYKGENTQVTFTPSSKNHYYYFQKDTQVFTDAECENPATVIDPEATYYYQESYFNGAKARTKVATIQGSEMSGSEIIIPKGTVKHANIDAQNVKKNNMLPSDMVVNDSISKYSLKADGKTVQNIMGNVAVYGIEKPNQCPKEFVLTYDALNEDKDVFTHIQADTKTDFDIWVDSDKEGKILGKIVDKDGKETVLENLTLKGHYIKNSDKAISLSFGDKLYLYGENFDPNTKVKVTVADTSPAFLDKTSMSKEADLVTGANEMVVCPKLLAEENLPETEISFKVGLTGERKENIPFNFTWSGEKNATVVGTIDPVTISSSADGTPVATTVKVKAPLGTSSIYIRQSDFQSGIDYDEGILKVNLKTVIDAEGTYVTSVTGYEMGRYVKGALKYVPIESPTFTNQVSAEAGTKVMVSGKLSLKKASTKVSETDSVSKSENIKYDQAMEAGEYKNPIQFKIEPDGTAAAFAVPTVTVDGSGMFSMISPALTEGTYTYKVTPLEAKGIDCGSASKTITLTVDSAGKVAVEGSLEFNGTYKPTGTITLNYVNNLTGRKFFGTEKIAVGETTLEYNGTKVSDTISNFQLSSTAGDSSASQSKDMSVYLPGEYVFSTKMEEGKGKSTMLSDVICYDLGGKKLTVQVVDNMDGTLTDGTLTVPENNNFELNWEYRPSQQTVETEDILVKADGFHLKAGEFQYQVTPLNGAPLGIYSSPISNPEMESATKQATIDKLKFQFTGKEITDLFDGQDIQSFADRKATFSYEVKELDQGSKFGHDQTEYRIDITFSLNDKARIQYAPTITKIKDSNGNVVNEPVTGPMEFNHSVTKNPVRVPLDQDITLLASVSGREKPLGEGEIALKAGALKSTDKSSIDIAKSNENVTIYGKDGQIISADAFVKEFSVKNDNDSKFVLSDYKVEFKEPGIYKLNLEPTNLGKGWNYTGTKSVIKYVVTEENGELKVHVSNEFGMNTLRYYFVYHPCENIDIYVQEEIFGREWSVDDEILSTIESDTGPNQSFSIGKLTENHEVKVATIELGESSQFTYTITNTIQTGGGLVKDKNEKQKVLKVTSTDTDKDGVLEITATLDGKEIELLPGNEEFNVNKNIKIGFKTQYKVNKEQKNAVSVVENFTGRPNNEWLDTDKFTFTLSANKADEATVKALESGEIQFTNSKITITKKNFDSKSEKYKAQFGDFTYTKEGTYQFVLTQEKPEMPCVSWNENKWEIVLDVHDNKKGNLVADVTAIEIENKYTTSSTSAKIVLPDGTVEVTGDGKVPSVAPLKDQQFKFNLVLDDKTVDTSANNAKGGISFKKLNFDKAGTYIYMIVPDGKQPDYWKLDSNSKDKIVTITVSDDNEGHLSVDKIEFNDSKFVYVYSVENASFEGLKVKKIFKGRVWEKDGFVINLALKSADGASKDDVTITNPNLTLTPSAKEQTYEPIIFSHTGTYVFKMSEEEPTDEESIIPGVIYDKSVKEITIEVTDDGNGSLIAKKVSGDLNNEFTNIYSTNTVTEKFTVTKFLTGRPKNAWLDTDTFTFTLEANDDVTKAAVKNKDITLTDCEITIKANDPEHKGSFGDITFKKAGKYKFDVKETKKDIPGIVYDESVKTIEVVTKDNGKGILTAEVKDNNGKTFDNGYLSFNNEYKITKTQSGKIELASGSVVVKGEKGSTPQPKDGEFTFEMKPSKTYSKDILELPKDMTAKNAADGSIVFNPITFKKPGTYVFEVTQDTSKEKAGWTLDASTKKVTFKVTDDNKGGLNVVAENVKDLKFTNTYTPSDAALAPAVSKELTGRDWKNEDVFEFTLASKDDYGKKVKLPTKTTVSITDEDTVKEASFDDITFSHTGTYTFNISEIDTGIKGIKYDSAKEFTVEVTDGGNGSLTTKVVSGSLNNAFTNTYVAAGVGKITVTKNLIGRPWVKGKDEYVFRLNANLADEDTRTAITNGDIEFDKRKMQIFINADSPNYQATFGPITFKKPGTYQFNVKEETKRKIPGIIYDESVKVITFEVNDKKLNGQYEVNMTSDSPLVFNNTYSPKPSDYAVTGLVGIDSQKGMKQPLQENQYTFTMKPSKTYSKDVLELPKDMMAKNAADGSIAFDPITFKKPGTYEFEVTQDTSEEKAGWTLDASKKNVTFKVTDDDQGGLKVVAENIKDLKFTNTYSPSDAALAPAVSMELTGRDWKSEDVFEFTLASKEDYGKKVKLPANTTIPITGKDEVKEASFDDITFSHTGTYTFSISEKDNGKGIKYDSAKEFTVEVQDDGNGSLTAKVVGGSLNNAFTNTYSAAPVTENFTVTKVLTGRPENAWLDTDEFTFTLEAKDNVTKAAVKNKDITLTDREITIKAKDPEHKGSFGDVTFNKAGTYQFNVKETKGDIPGVGYDESVKTVKVEVTDNLEGNLVAKVENQSISFTNEYKITKTQSGKIELASGSVVVKGEKGVNPQLEKGEFTFEMEPSKTYSKDVLELPKDMTAKNAADGSIAFDPITFKKPGTYEFEVTQDTSKEKAGWTLDASTKKVTFKVTDDNKGGLKVVAEHDKNSSFNNSYSLSDATFTTSVGKNLTGRNWKTNDKFEFTLASKEDYGKKVKLPANTTISITGENKVKEASFDNITFSHTGTYTFNVSEKNNGLKGVEYDTQVNTIQVKVSDNGKGALVATRVGEGKEPFYFNNNYVPKDAVVEGSTDLKFSSSIEGRNWKEDETFTFNLVPVTKDAPMPENAVITVGKPEKGNSAEFSFENITFKHSDMTDAQYTEDGVAFKNFEYTLQQQAGATDNGVLYDTAVRNITITVSDKGDGSLTVVSKLSGNTEFSNVYKTSMVYDDLQIKKTLVGRDMQKDQFTFLVSPQDKESAEMVGKKGKEDVILVKNPSAENGQPVTMLAFEGIKLTDKDHGKTFTYVVSEENGGKNVNGIAYDASVYTVVIKVNDDMNGHLTTETTISKDGQIVSTSANNQPAVVSFANTYYAEGTLSGIAAQNILTGRPQNPGEFTFQVLDNKGNAVATTTNPSAGGGVPAILTFAPIQYTSTTVAQDVNAGIAHKNSDGEYVYSYTVRELIGAGSISAGVSPIRSEYQIIVKLKDDGQGHYGTSVIYPEGYNQLIFENSYDAESAVLNMSGSTKLNVPEGSKITVENLAGKYTYTIAGISDDASKPVPMPPKTTATNDLAGNFDFGNITYSMDLLKDVEPDENGVRSVQYKYQVTQSGGATGVISGNNVINFTVIVKDAGEGFITTEVVYETAGQSGNNKFEFVNAYVLQPVQSSMTENANYVVSKALSGRQLQQGEFTFELKDKDNNVVSSGVNNADGTVYMTPITFTRPGTYSFILYEVNGGKTLENGITYDAKTEEVVAVLTDNEDGTMNLQWNSGTVTFKNKYKAAPSAVTLSASKHLQGKKIKAGEFSFVLKDENGKVIQTKQNDENGAIMFDEIMYDEEGSWNYTIEERKGNDVHMKYDDQVYKVTVTTKDDLQGHLVAEVVTSDKEVVFHNVYTGPSDSGDGSGQSDSGGNGSNQPGSDEDDNSDTASQTGATMWFMSLMGAGFVMTSLFAKKKRNRI